MRSILAEKPVNWKYSDGFMCALTLIIISIITDQTLWFFYRNNVDFAKWSKANENLEQGLLLLVRSGSWILTIFILARVRSPRVFLDQLGLRKQFTLSGWICAWVSMGIGLLALYGVAKHWIPPNQLTRSFYYGGDPSRLFIACYAVLIAPLSEEAVMRGFLYRAFRLKYKIYLSILFVLCVHAYFHWNLITRSFYTFTCLVSLEILLCVLREWTGSTWNCVLCHAAYNATQNLPWFLFPLGLILYLPILCMSRMQASNQMNSTSQPQ